MGLLNKTMFTGNILSLLRLFVHDFIVSAEFFNKEFFPFLPVHCITLFDFFQDGKCHVFPTVTR